MNKKNRSENKSTTPAANRLCNFWSSLYCGRPSFKS